MWDDEAGYDRDDPKHPDWHGTMAGIWDNRDKTVVPDDDEDDEVEGHRRV